MLALSNMIPYRLIIFLTTPRVKGIIFLINELFFCNTWDERGQEIQSNLKLILF